MSKNLSQDPSVVRDPLANIMYSLFNKNIEADEEGEPLFPGYTGKTYFVQQVPELDGDTTLDGMIEQSEDGQNGWEVLHAFAQVTVDTAVIQNPFQYAEVNMTLPYVRYNMVMGGASETPSVTPVVLGVF